MTTQDQPTLTETTEDGLLLTYVCGNRVQALPPGLRANPTWGTDGLECPNCECVFVVLPGGEIFQSPSSEEEYQEVVERWQLADDFKTALVADLKNPTQARVNEVHDWARRIIFGGLPEDDIAIGRIDAGRVLIEAIEAGTMSVADFCDGRPLFQGRTPHPGRQ